MLRKIGRDTSGNWRVRFGISERRLRRCDKLTTLGDIAKFAVEVGRKAVASAITETRESPVAVLDIDPGRVQHGKLVEVM